MYAPHSFREAKRSSRRLMRERVVSVAMGESSHDFAPTEGDFPACLPYSGMAVGSVRFTLDDGETIIVPDDELRRIYESLWAMSPEPGAVSTAALVMDVSRLSHYGARSVELTTPQSAVFRKAVALLHV